MKSSSKKTEENKIIPLDKAVETEQVTSAILKAKINDLKKELTERLSRQENQSFAIMLGAVVVAILFVLGIIWNSQQFMAGYNQHYLDAQKNFDEKTANLEKNNAELENQLQRQIDQLSARQDYLEKMTLNKASLK